MRDHERATSAARRLAWAIAVAILSGVGCSGAPAALGSAPAAPAAKAPLTSKVRIPAAQIVELGALAPHAKVLADYGAFALVQIREAALGAVSALPGAQRVASDDVLLDTGAIDPHSKEGQALRGLRAPPAYKALRLVQFVGPIQPAWHRALVATGVRVVSYIPQNAYLVWGDAPSLEALQHLIDTDPSVQWDSAYRDNFKVNPSVHGKPVAAYDLQLVKDDKANADTLARIRAVQARAPVVVTSPLGYLNVRAFVSQAQALELAAQPDVVSIYPHRAPKALDERQDMLVSGHVPGAGYAHGYLAWLASKGFTQAQFDASGFGVDIADTGLGNGTLLPYHPDFYKGGDTANPSRVVYQRCYDPHCPGTRDPNSYDSLPAVPDCVGHGTFVASEVGGFNDQTGTPYQDADGFSSGLGVVPFVRLGVSQIVYGCGEALSDDSQRMVPGAYASGMRITSNSWGSGSDPTEGFFVDYDDECQTYDALVRDAQPAGTVAPADGNQEMVAVFAAGNDGHVSYDDDDDELFDPDGGAMSISSPGQAKNVVTVGASEVPTNLVNSDFYFGNDFEDMAYFSSEGPAADGRRKPDLAAPGYFAWGARPLDSSTDTNLYTTLSGTSMATPAVSGGAALLRQDFINQGLTPPSPAMTKAFLMNTARYLTGTYAGDTLPSNEQGMGLMDLDRAFDRVPRMLDDESPAHLFTATGQTQTFTSFVTDPTKPFRATLAWTDAPGPTDAAAWVNDLDLTVDVGGVTYLGNVFSGATSVAGGTADGKNNVESVFLPAGTTGPVTVTVTAANIAGDGVPNNASPLDQDFALVAYNACGGPPTFAGLEYATPDFAATCETMTIWNPATPVCGGAITYAVYRSQDPNFTPSFATEIASGITGTSYVDEANLVGDEKYYYAVRAEEASAQGAWQDTNTVKHSVVVQVQGSGCTTTVPPPGPPVVLKLQGLASSVVALQPTSFEVSAVDAVGVPTAGDVALSSSDPDAELPATASLSTMGPAQVSLAFHQAGPQTLTATLSGDPRVTASASTTVVPAAASALHFEATPSAGTAGATLPAITVSIVDAAGNTVTGATDTVSIALGANPGGATLSGTLTVTPVNGVATFSDLSLDKVGAGDTLVASAAGLGSVASGPFDISAGPATRFVVSLPATAIVGEEVTATAQAFDAHDNAATDYAGEVNLTTSDPAATFPASVSFSGGALTIQGAFGTAGAQTLTLVDTASSSLTGSATIQVAAPATATSSSSSSTTGGTSSSSSASSTTGGTSSSSSSSSTTGGTSSSSSASSTTGGTQTTSASSTTGGTSSSSSAASTTGGTQTTSASSTTGGTQTTTSASSTTGGTQTSSKASGCGCTGGGSNVELLAFALIALGLRRRR